MKPEKPCSRPVNVLFLFIASLVFSSPVFAQNGIEAGFKAGYHYFRFIDNEDGHYYATYHYPDNGWFVAANLNIPSPGTFSLNLELQYLHREFGVESGWGGLGGGSEANYHFKLGSLYLKTEPRFNFKWKKFKFHFYPGIVIGAMANSTLTGTLYSWGLGTPYYTHTDTIHDNAKGKYPDLEFGLLAGCGAGYQVNNDLRIVFDYDFRFIFYPDQNGWGRGPFKIYGMDFGLGVVYSFRKK